MQGFLVINMKTLNNQELPLLTLLSRGLNDTHLVHGPKILRGKFRFAVKKTIRVSFKNFHLGKLSHLFKCGGRNIQGAPRGINPDVGNLSIQQKENTTFEGFLSRQCRSGRLGAGEKVCNRLIFYFLLFLLKMILFCQTIHRTYLFFCY